MDPDIAEKFFRSYLNEQGLKFTVKGRVYTVKLDRTHKKWYDTEVLTCTFDTKVAKEKKIELLGVGNMIFDSMIAQYVDDVLVANLRIKGDHEEGLMEVNERLHELDKGKAVYRIDEEQRVGHFILFEVAIKTAHNKRRISVPLILLGDAVIPAEGFERNDFEMVEEDVRAGDVIEDGLAKLPYLLKGDLDDAEKEHHKDMEELIRIQTTHCEDQYTELQKKENMLLHKMEEERQKTISASSFAAKNKANDRIKELKRKHTELVEKNKQIEDLRMRELSVDAKVLSIAKIEFPVYVVGFEDNESYYYVPAVKRFQKREPMEQQVNG